VMWSSSAGTRRKRDPARDDDGVNVAMESASVPWR